VTVLEMVMSIVLAALAPAASADTAKRKARDTIAAKRGERWRVMSLRPLVLNTSALRGSTFESQSPVWRRSAAVKPHVVSDDEEAK
jgi:hypothetical protein